MGEMRRTMNLGLLVAGVAAAVVVTIGGTSCATDNDKVTWDEVHDDSSTREVARASKLQTQDEYDRVAGELLSAVLCEQEARHLLGEDKRGGLMMMMGCMRRPDFTSLMAFSNPPWDHVRFSEAQYPLILDVAMRRGGVEVAADFAQLGVQVQPIDIFLAEEEPKNGALVEARVLALRSDQLRDGSTRTIARVYGYGKQTGYRVSRSRFGFNTFGQSESKEVKAIGVTIELRSPRPLPKERRVQVVARYLRDRTSSMKARQDKELSAFVESGVDPSKLDDPKSDPPPSLAFEVVAVESATSSSKELPGSTEENNSSFYKIR